MPWNKEDEAFIPISRSYYSPLTPEELPVIVKPNVPPPPPVPGDTIPPPPQARGAPLNPPTPFPNPSPPPSPLTPCPHTSKKGTHITMMTMSKTHLPHHQSVQVFMIDAKLVQQQVTKEN
ncbi:hypothetical protein FRB95_014190 [Tulasnella sp. JGI-2019a]|nr:hypothetical protein FRB95_014190 [Tulasnella sp. JGI-2019a]